jgi:hypothetical protein
MSHTRHGRHHDGDDQYSAAELIERTREQRAPQRDPAPGRHAVPNEGDLTVRPMVFGAAEYTPRHRA